MVCVNCNGFSPPRFSLSKEVKGGREGQCTSGRLAPLCWRTLLLIWNTEHHDSSIRYRRLCNKIMFGMGPTDDPRDSLSLDEVVCDEGILAASGSTLDKQ